MGQPEKMTKKQKELLHYVSSFVTENDYSPSYREIMSALGYKSVSTVATHVEGLIAKGYLERKDNAARSLNVVATNTTSESSAKKEINDAISRYRASDELDKVELLTKALSLL